MKKLTNTEPELKKALLKKKIVYVRKNSTLNNGGVLDTSLRNTVHILVLGKPEKIFKNLNYFYYLFCYRRQKRFTYQKCISV